MRRIEFHHDNAAGADEPDANGWRRATMFSKASGPPYRPRLPDRRPGQHNLTPCKHKIRPVPVETAQNGSTAAVDVTTPAGTTEEPINAGNPTHIPPIITEEHMNTILRRIT